jgi:anti-sigma-K factor RskA
VWTQPDPEAGPVSLGLLRQIRGQTLEAFDLPPPAPDQFYAVSVEPETGSPTGLPTGPVIATGLAKVPR